MASIKVFVLGTMTMTIEKGGTYLSISAGSL